MLADLWELYRRIGVHQVGTFAKFINSANPIDRLLRKEKKYN
jgi:hypothetical protein